MFPTTLWNEKQTKLHWLHVHPCTVAKIRMTKDPQKGQWHTLHPHYMYPMWTLCAPLKNSDWPRVPTTANNLPHTLCRPYIHLIYAPYMHCMCTLHAPLVNSDWPRVPPSQWHTLHTFYGTLYAPYMYPMYILCAPYVDLICCLCVPYRYLMCTLHAPKMHPRYPLKNSDWFPPQPMILLKKQHHLHKINGTMPQLNSVVQNMI